jgi:hypothetical protein
MCGTITGAIEESQALMAEEFTRLASEDSLPTNAVPIHGISIHYMTSVVFSISAFPDKPFVTTDLKELRSESIYIRRNAASYFQMNSQTKSSHPSNALQE